MTRDDVAWVLGDAVFIILVAMLAPIALALLCVRAIHDRLAS